MRIKITGVMVLDQEKAMQFYTKKLGFIVKHDIPLGEGNRWLTVVSPEDPEGTELLLEPAPNHFEPAKVYQKALFAAGIPHHQFYVDDLDAEYKRLLDLDVEFSMTPTEMGTVKIAVLHDTCGNNIQILQEL